MTNRVKTTPATARIDQGTQYLDAVQQAEEKELRERFVAILGVTEAAHVNPSPRERNNVDRERS